MITTSPENAADIATLKTMLSAAPIGQTLSYAAMTVAIGRDVKDRPWIMIAARKEVEKETGGLFETVRGIGVQRLPSAKIPDAGLHTLRKLRKCAKRGAERLANVRVNDLSNTERQQVIAYRSQLGAISLIADGRKTQKIVPNLQSGEPLPAGRVLELFTRGAHAAE